MAEHVVAQTQDPFYGFLGLPAVALAVVVRALFFAVDIELEHVGLATTLHAVLYTIDRKLQTDQHVFAVGLVDKIVAFDIGQGLSIQGIAQRVDDRGLASTISRTVAAEI